VFCIWVGGVDLVFGAGDGGCCGVGFGECRVECLFGYDVFSYDG